MSHVVSHPWMAKTFIERHVIARNQYHRIILFEIVSQILSSKLDDLYFQRHPAAQKM